MEFQAIGMALQILMLTIGWVLFQKARAELAAQAQETPVLSEVRALHRNVKALLAEIEAAGDRVSERVERRCQEAQSLLAQFDAVLSPRMEAESGRNSDWEDMTAQPVGTVSTQTTETETSPNNATQHNSRYNVEENIRKTRREEVYLRADAGETAPQIARETGLSEGEVETLLGLRAQRSTPASA